MVNNGVALVATCVDFVTMPQPLNEQSKLPFYEALSCFWKLFKSIQLIGVFLCSHKPDCFLLFVVIKESKGIKNANISCYY